ncbi:MAG: hypothetical protein ACFFDT_35925 [Candidatus Hodarchaeota archaeon]
MQYKYARVLVMIIPLIVIGILSYMTLTMVAWHISSGVFIKAEVHPERQMNVTWIQLEGKELIYCTYNPEVLELIPGEMYWFGEGLMSGNYGKTLLWVSDEPPTM